MNLFEFFKRFNTPDQFQFEGITGDPLLDEPDKIKSGEIKFEPIIKITGTGVNRPPPRGDLVPTALVKAFNEYIRNEIQPRVNFDDGAIFQLNEIVLKQSTENIALLHDLIGLKEKLRNNLGLACLKKTNYADMIDLQRYFGWTISQETAGIEAEVYTQIAGTGFDNVKLDFYFFGEWIEKEGLPKTLPVKAADVAQEAAFLSLILENDRRHEIKSLRELPLTIGRHSSCGLRLENDYVAREHARIAFDANTGKVTISNCCDKGLVIEDASGIMTHIAQGKSRPLPSPTGLIVLAPTAGVRAERINYNFAQISSDDIPTLSPPKHGDDTATLLPESVNSLNPVKSETQESTKTVVENKTVLDSNPAVKPLAWVEVRYDHGRIKRVPILQTPFVIGREPMSEQGLTVDDPTDRVSRKHLIVMKSPSGGFMTEHGGDAGSWFENGDKIGNAFIWPTQRMNANVNAGWISMADKTGSIQVRLLVDTHAT